MPAAIDLDRGMIADISNIYIRQVIDSLDSELASTVSFTDRDPAQPDNLTEEDRL